MCNGKENKYGSKCWILIPHFAGEMKSDPDKLTTVPRFLSVHAELIGISIITLNYSPINFVLFLLLHAKKVFAKYSSYLFHSSYRRWTVSYHLHILPLGTSALRNTLFFLLIPNYSHILPIWTSFRLALHQPLCVS